MFVLVCVFALWLCNIILLLLALLQSVWSTLPYNEKKLNKAYRVRHDVNAVILFANSVD